MRYPIFSASALARYVRASGWLLEFFCVYGTLALAFVVTVFAFWSWEDAAPVRDRAPLPFSYFEENEQVTPGAALVRLRGQTPVPELNTRRSEQPFWLLVPLPVQMTRSGDVVLDFPSRHGTGVACWDAQDLRLLGYGNRREVVGDVTPARAGFALTVPPASQPRSLLCRVEFWGAAHATVVARTPVEMNDALNRYHRVSGLLDGGMLTMVALAVVAALMLRQQIYLLLVAWLVLNLRVAAVLTGMDFQWFGHRVPFEWQAQPRMVTLTLFIVVTLVLFTALCREPLEKAGRHMVMAVAQTGAAVALALAFVIPVKPLSILITVCVPLFGAAFFYLGYHAFRNQRSASMLWYCTSLSVAIIGGMAEILSQTGMRWIPTSASSLVAVSFSSFCAACALAERVRESWLQRAAAQAETEETYRSLPVGLFTADTDGHIVASNPAFARMLGVDAAGSRWTDHFPAESWDELVSAAERDQACEMEPSDSAGRGRRFSVRASLARNRIEGAVQDITEQSRALGELQFLSDHDAATGLLNARGAEQAFEAAVHSLAGGRPFAFAYIDADRLARAGVVHGHDMVDAVLRRVGERVQEAAVGMRVARLDGAHFAVLMPDTEIGMAEWTCSSVLHRISAAPVRIGNRAFHLSPAAVLIEVAAAMSMREAVALAQRGLRSGTGFARGRTLVYRRDAPEFAESRIEMQIIEWLISADPAVAGLDVRPALRSSPADPAVSEAVLCFSDLGGERVPDRLVEAAATHSGMTGVGDLWTVSMAAEWIERAPSGALAVVTLRPASLCDEQFRSEVLSAIAFRGSSAERLLFAIPLETLLGKDAGVYEFLGSAAALGVRVVADGVGAGAARFELPDEIPVEGVRFDVCLTDEAGAGGAEDVDPLVLRAAVLRARSRGLRTYARGVRSVEQWRALAAAGIDYVQMLPDGPHDAVSMLNAAREATQPLPAE